MFHNVFETWQTLFELMAVFGSLAAAILLIAAVAYIRNGHGYTLPVVALVFAAGIGGWDYLVVDSAVARNAAQQRVDQMVVLVENPSTPASVVAKAAASSEKEIRRAAAVHAAAGATTLAALAVDTDPVVRAVIAARVDTPPAVLASLANDTDDEVVAAALGNPSTPASTLSRSFQTLQPSQDATSGVSDAGLRVAAASHPSAGAVTLRLLAADPEPSVRAVVAARSDAPGDVLAALAEDPDPSVRSAAASNPSTPAAAPPAGGSPAAVP